MGREALRGLGRSIRGEGDGAHWIERMMGPEQRTLFRETQAVMSLLEGFSDYVMDEVGRDLVPDVAVISARFHERRTKRTAIERSILRLTGMDLKLEQYRKGELFVRAIAEAARPDRARQTVGRPRNAPARWRDRGPGALDRAASSTARPRDRHRSSAGRARVPERAAHPRRSPSARSFRPATARATSSGSGRRRRGLGS